VEARASPLLAASTTAFVQGWNAAEPRRLLAGAQEGGTGNLRKARGGEKSGERPLKGPGARVKEQCGAALKSRDALIQACYDTRRDPAAWVPSTGARLQGRQPAYLHF